MTGYVDGFILPIPKRNRAKYLKMARAGSRLWIKHGALQYFECAADDVAIGKLTSFPRAVKLQAGEEAWFSFIVYKSRKHRDQVNAKVMSDPWMKKYDPKNVPFDGKRMIYGGFKAMVRR